MLVMASQKPPRAFAPSDRAPAKPTVQYTLRLTDTERDILERAAAAAGVTALNLIRQFLADGLAPKRRPKK